VRGAPWVRRCQAFPSRPPAVYWGRGKGRGQEKRWRDGTAGTGASAEFRGALGPKELAIASEKDSRDGEQREGGASGGTAEAEVSGDVSFQPWARHVVFSVPGMAPAGAEETLSPENATAQPVAEAEAEAEAEAGQRKWQRQRQRERERER